MNMQKTIQLVYDMEKNNILIHRNGEKINNY